MYTTFPFNLLANLCPSAAQWGHPEVCTALAAAGANLEYHDGDGATALILAAQNTANKGDEPDTLASVNALLKAGANVNTATHDGFTALLVRRLP